MRVDEVHHALVGLVPEFTGLADEMLEKSCPAHASYYAEVGAFLTVARDAVALALNCLSELEDGELEDGD